VRENRTKGNLGPIPSRSSALSQFEPGGSCGPIEDANEYEALIGAITDPEKREFLEETSRLIEKTGRRAFLRQADVRNFAALNSVVDAPTPSARDRSWVSIWIAPFQLGVRA